MNDHNPYAPPEADVGSRAKRKIRRDKTVSDALATALERLDEHLADPEKVAADQKEAAGKFRLSTKIVAGIAGIVVVASVLVGTDLYLRSDVMAVVGMRIWAVILTIVAFGMVIVDVRLPSRDKPASPEEALRYFFEAISRGRYGYAWTALCPTARDEYIDAPWLGPIPVGTGPLILNSSNHFELYLKWFARPDTSHMRTMKVKRTTPLSEDDNVAVVESTLRFRAWPQWIQFGPMGAVLILRIPGGILLALAISFVLALIMRKTHEITFRKTLIRGRTGVWYVYSGDLFEGAARYTGE